MPPLILASGSAVRATLLRNAGVQFTVQRPDVDERAIEDAVKNTGITPDELAAILAEAKADCVSIAQSGSLVIGCDQTLSLGDRVFHKPADMEGARRHLLELSGQTHHLNSAVVLSRDGETFWRHTAVASMTMRELSPAFVGQHLARVGSATLASVGAYQLEGEGIQLMDRIEGDYFAILGLPLLPLLGALRAEGAVP